MTMTPKAKSQLSDTIRDLRTRLLGDFKSANESTYKYSIRRIDQARLIEANATRRRRIEAWTAEQVRCEAGKKNKRVADAFRRDLEKQAAYTLLNRLLILRLMEASGLHVGDLVAKGWQSDVFGNLRYFSAEIVENDDTEGLSFWLRMVFDDLATDMPGLYGDAGMSEYIPVRTQTLRSVVEAFADPALDSCWTDDMTLGWVYQYWNDPDRNELDKKIKAGGKIELHEIASKTQMFTERYMVDWLLQNSLGPMWLAVCQKHDWTSLVESTGTLDALERRRVDWRARRDAGEVELTELMPLETELEHRWAYYVPQPIPDDAVEHAPESVRELKILDPAVGSGHFLIVAFDLLYALYEEEARHRGETADQQKWSSKAIVESILENNLHGIDLDPRAVQIAAAALWIKAKSKCADAHPSRLNLVASNLGIARLPDNDPALVELRDSVEKETGIPAELTDHIIEALRGAEHLGSLLKIDKAIDKAIDEAIEKYQVDIGREGNAFQLKMFPDGRMEQQSLPFPKERATKSVLAAIESFLHSHSGPDELGLRLHGEQLAAGVRLLRLTRDGTYDIVAMNPPYLGTDKLSKNGGALKIESEGGPDLFAAFCVRSSALAKVSGRIAMIALRNWMFIPNYQSFREWLIANHDIGILADLHFGAFAEVKDVSVAMWSVRKTAQPSRRAYLQAMRLDLVNRDQMQIPKNIAGLASHSHVFIPSWHPSAIEQSPLVYWWSKEFLRNYQAAPKLGEIAPVREGMSTSNNSRFVRRVWETNEWHATTPRLQFNEMFPPERTWAPYVMGAKGQTWVEPLQDVVNWLSNGLEMKVLQERKYGSVSRRIQSQSMYFRRGVAYSAIGRTFTARAHRFPSIFAQVGSSVFPRNIAHVTCMLNSEHAAQVASDLNPTLHYNSGDIARLPMLSEGSATSLFEFVETQFSLNECVRENSVEFVAPSPSSWQSAVDWATRCVNNTDNELSEDFVPEFVEPTCEAYLSYAFGVAIGRFDANGLGTLDDSCSVHTNALPHGILYLDGSIETTGGADSLADTKTTVLHEAWANQSSEISRETSLRDWLRLKFFNDVHNEMYKNRPIYLPVASKNKTFVAFISIHRCNANTLRHLLADHLRTGTLPRIDGELEDLRKNRGDKDTDVRFAKVKALKEELDEFIALLNQCTEKGPPPSGQDCPKREVDVRYDPDLDDGVMINSAALWPLLEPIWNDPKDWWKQLSLSTPTGSNKDYDWSHLAMRYWPTRVDEKCQKDPSLGVAHGCFWKYHPARAWAWELRLQDEIAPDFRIEEAVYREDGGDTEHRNAYIRDEPLEAIAAIEKEVHRRRKNAKGKILRELTILEPGLWSAEPEACWNMETRIIKKQEFGFRLIAPDEEAARAKLLKETPQKATGRNKLLQNRGGETGYLVGWQEAVEEA